MRLIFDFVVLILFKISEITKLTYNEVNIILYYYVIPLVSSIIIDYKIGIPIFTIIVLPLYFIIKRNAEELFIKSVFFLQSFGNYVVNSILFCVIIPFLWLIILVELF